MPKFGDRVKIINGKWGVVKYIVNTEFNNNILIGIELNNWYENASNGRIKGVCYFKTEEGKGFFTKLENLIRNRGTCPKLIKKEWEIEKLLWIAFYKNENNQQCFIPTLPKVIVNHILIWLRLHSR